MEDIPPIGDPRHEPLTLPNATWFQDHRFLGQAVLPGVCALEHLARTVGRAFPGAALAATGDIRFDKLLVLPPSNVAQVEAIAELAGSLEDGIGAVLLTRHVAPKSGMTRMKAHVRACFGICGDATGALPPVPVWPEEAAETYQLPPNRLYAEMVPFGTAFQNVVSPVQLRPGGARAVVSGGRQDIGGSFPRLGSPFPLDAAFHAACAWAQRYAGLVAFPVAMRQRVIRRLTIADRRYHF